MASSPRTCALRPGAAARMARALSLTSRLFLQQDVSSDQCAKVGVSEGFVKQGLAAAEDVAVQPLLCVSEGEEVADVLRLCAPPARAWAE